MAEYKIKIIGALGHFVRSFPIVCTDDKSAIATAKQFIDGHDIELWQRNRQIARFDHNTAAGSLKVELRPPK
jgi:hypothetical protein